MAAKIKITVITHKSGYELRVNGNEYFYFSADDLLAGLTCHVIEGKAKPAIVRDAKLKPLTQIIKPKVVTDVADIQKQLDGLGAEDKYKTPRRIREREVVRYHKNRDKILQQRRERYARKKQKNEQ